MVNTVFLVAQQSKWKLRKIWRKKKRFDCAAYVHKGITRKRKGKNNLREQWLYVEQTSSRHANRKVVWQIQSSDHLTCSSSSASLPDCGLPLKYHYILIKRIQNYCISFWHNNMKNQIRLVSGASFVGKNVMRCAISIALPMVMKNYYTNIFN